MLASNYWSLFLTVLVVLFFESVKCRVYPAPDADHANTAWLQVTDAQKAVLDGEALSQSIPAVPAMPVVPSVSSYCQGCALRRTEMEAMLTEIEITALRIQHVKEQILNKLRLTEPPKIRMQLAGLPKPLTRGTALLATSASRQEAEDNNDVDDFYGKTDQVVVLLAEMRGDHTSPHRQAVSVGFSLTLPASLEADDVTDAQLWLYKGSNASYSSFPTYHVMSEAMPVAGGESVPAKTIAVQKTSSKEGWFKVDLGWSVKEWLESQHLSHRITVACPSCTSPVGSQGSHKPFFVISTTPVNQKSRTKRHTNCSPTMSECCREKLYINFANIGWDEWILQPTGYDAYYCRGSCTSAATLTISGSHYHTIIRKFLQKIKPDRSLELVPCCTATRLTSLQLLYMDSNQMITQTTLPNMVVASCGCM